MVVDIGMMGGHTAALAPRDDRPKDGSHVYLPCLMGGVKAALASCTKTTSGTGVHEDLTRKAGLMTTTGSRPLVFLAQWSEHLCILGPVFPPDMAGVDHRLRKDLSRLRVAHEHAELREGSRDD